MKPEIERGIILDTDMIALGDIKELWDVDLKGRVCGAVPIYNLTSMEYLREITNIIGIKLKHIYMNMGTLLVDFKKWRETDMLAKLASIPIHFDTEKYCAWDEMLLNAVLQETGYTILDPKFNMSNPLLTYYKKGKPIEHRQVIEDYIGLSPDYRPLEIVLLHYVHAKPLYSPYFQYPPLKTKINVDGYKEFWNFLSMTPFYAGEYMSLFVNKSQLMHASLLKILKSGTYRRKLALYRILNALTFGLIPGLKRKKEKVKEQLSLDIW